MTLFSDSLRRHEVSLRDKFWFRLKGTIPRRGLCDRGKHASNLQNTQATFVAGLGVWMAVEFLFPVKFMLRPGAKTMAVGNVKKKQLLDAVEECRSIVLHVVEFELHDSAYWESVRSRILKAFGDKGLSGQIQKLFSESDKAGGQHE